MIQEKDIYVCESRYTSRIRAFKKIKLWSVPRNNSVRTLLREALLSPVRVQSVFAKESSPAQPEDVEDSTWLDKQRQVCKIIM